MRPLILIIGLFLSVLFGGTAYAMAAHDCDPQSMAGGHQHMAHDRTADRHDGGGLTHHCCDHSGMCRMAGCSLAIFAEPPTGTDSLLEPVSAVLRDTPALRGRAVAPLHGPPRQIPT